MTTTVPYSGFLELVEAALSGKNVDPLTRSVIAYLMYKAKIEKDRIYLRLLFYILSKLGLYPCKISLSMDEINTLRRIEMEVKEQFQKGPNNNSSGSRRYTLRFSIRLNALPSPITIHSEILSPSMGENEIQDRVKVSYGHFSQVYLI